MTSYRRYISVKNSEEKKDDSTPEMHGSYGALLFDKRWKNKRSAILLRDSYQCVICGLSDKLEVHHRQYHYLSAQNKFKAPWEYSDEMLISLCVACHQRGHAKFKVPIINL